MTLAQIIEEAMADGVNIAVSTSGTIKATGDQAAVSRWLPIIRERKSDIIAMLTKATNDSTSWGWLLHYPDRDPLEVYSSPESTLAQVLHDFPGADAAEPIEEQPCVPPAPPPGTSLIPPQDDPS